jgi:hypothetical protein
MSFAAKLVRHRRRVAHIGQNELRAEAGTDRGCARADPARAAGNENGLAFQRERMRACCRH